MKTSWKRLLSLAICLVTLFVLLQTTAGATDIVSGPGWNLDSNGVLHITGAVPASGFGLSNSQKQLVTSVVTSTGASISSGRKLFSQFDKMTSADLSKLNTSGVTDMSNMFYRCSSLTSLDVTNFDTSRVTDMHEMFSYCTDLTSLDVTHFDTSRVTDMNGMFDSCSSLTSLDVTHFNTSRVTDMSLMFYDCSNLTSLDVTRFDTSRVTNMYGMFYNCSGLTSLDVTHFNTSSVNTMASMFFGCSNLASLDVTHFNTSSVANMERMFCGCKRLTTLDLGSFDTSSLENARYAVLSCNALTTIQITPGILQQVAENLIEIRTPWQRQASTTYYYTAEDLMAVTETVTLITPRSYEGPGWNLDKTGVLHITGAVPAEGFGLPYTVGMQVKSVVTAPGASITSGRELFYRFENMTSVNLDNLDTSKVTDMTRMFYSCKSLTSLNMGSLDTRKVTNMSYLFAYCSNLIRVGLEDFDTSSAADMYAMFTGCSRLIHVDLSSFDTSGVTRLDYLFYDCTSLAAVDVSGFETYSTTSMEDMFLECPGLVSLRLTPEILQANAESLLRVHASWQKEGTTDTYSTASALRAVKDTVTLIVPGTGYYVTGDHVLHICGAVSSGWLELDAWDEKESTIKAVVTTPGASITHGTTLFRNYYNMTSADLSHLDTSEVTNMSQMFYNCSSLTSLDVSGFDTSSVTDMQHMFSFCSNLTTLDVSGFDTRNVADTRFMFYGCSGLLSLDVSGFDFNDDSDVEYMFHGCSSLTYLKITSLLVRENCNTLLGLHPIWQQYGSDVTYSTLAELEAVDETVALIVPGSTWYLAGDGVLHIFGAMPANGFGLTYTQREQVKSVVTTPGASIASGSHLFDSFVNMTSVELKYLDTSAVTNMDGMFLGCASLQAAVVRDLVTDHVTTMHAMFSGCSSLSFVDISSFSTANVTDMSAMLYGCSGLLGFNAGDLDTSKVGDMNHMFFGCSLISYLDLSGLDTQNVLDMNSMFSGCRKLNFVDVSSFDTTSLADADAMFSLCPCLIEVGTNRDMLAETADQLMNIAPVWADDMGKVHTSAAGLKGVSGKVTLTKVAHSGDGWYIDAYNRLILTGPVTNPSTAASDLTPWREYKDIIYSVYAMDGASIDNGVHLFSYCSNMDHLDLRKLDTSNVKDFSYMFGADTAIEINLSGWNTSKAENMSAMFILCAVEDLYLDGWDTSHVTDMSGMFFMTANLKELDLSGFDTSSVTTLMQMFYNCVKLETLDISGFSTTLVKDASGMFTGCAALSTISTNQAMLSKTASQLLTLSPAWTDRSGKVYTSTDDLGAVTGKVTLRKGNLPAEDTDCGGNPALCPLAPFTDAPGYANWAHKGIEFCVSKGLMSGTSATTFGPKLTMSRSMLVTVLYRMAGQPGAGSTKFSDVPAGQWYSAAVSWAADKGIVSGVGGGRFDPNGSVTREQLATILYRYAGYKGYDTSKKDNLSGFADASQVGTWFVDGMKWAVAENLITGSAMNGKTYLTPQGAATREQVAAILMRFIQNIGD